MKMKESGRFSHYGRAESLKKKSARDRKGILDDLQMILDDHQMILDDL